MNKNGEGQLTVEQLTTAVAQFNLAEKTKLLQAIANNTHEAEFAQLINALFQHPPLNPPKPQQKLRQDWAGALKDEPYTSVELQHLASKWRKG